MKCAKCGDELSPTAKFCGKCGEKVEYGTKFCSSCGAVLSDGSKFCQSCGNPVVVNPVQNTSAQPPFSTANASGTGCLIVIREKQIGDLLRAYKIFIDGNEVGKIKNGKQEQFELPFGVHYIRFEIDWVDSNHFQFELSPAMPKAIIKCRRDGDFDVWQAF